MPGFAQNVILLGQTALVSGSLSYGSKLLWDRTTGQEPASLVPQRIRRVLHLSAMMTRNADVMLRALLHRRDIAGIAHQVTRRSFHMRPFQPLCCAGWREEEKLKRLLDHFDTVTALGGIFEPARNEVRTLSVLRALGEDYRLTVDEPDWLGFDGLTALSLWKGIDRLFTISIILSSGAGRLGCYVGGLQGRGGDTVRDLYRDMTKQAHGLRPRDLMIELHRMVCRELGVGSIKAIAEQARFSRDSYYRHSDYQVTSLNYDEAWSDRGGIPAGEHWYLMPIEPVRRDESEIPAKKRGLYRQRYALLDALEDEVSAAVRALVPGFAARPARTRRALLAPRYGVAAY